MQTIVELFEFQRCAKALKMSQSELESLKDKLAANPSIGIDLGSGLYKVRLAKQGRGKSGGYRIIYFFRKTDIPIVLISAFAKNQKANLSTTELKLFRQLCDTLEKQFRRQS